jgi:hypothetical protein
MTRKDAVPNFRAALWARDQDFELRTVAQQPVRLEETRRGYAFSVSDYHEFPTLVRMGCRVQYDKTQDLTLVFLPKPRWYLDEMVWCANKVTKMNMIVVVVLAAAYVACLAGLL